MKFCRSIEATRSMGGHCSKSLTDPTAVKESPSNLDQICGYRPGVRHAGDRLRRAAVTRRTARWRRSARQRHGDGERRVPSHPRLPCPRPARGAAMRPTASGLELRGTRSPGPAEGSAARPLEPGIGRASLSSKCGAARPAPCWTTSMTRCAWPPMASRRPGATSPARVQASTAASHAAAASIVAESSMTIDRPIARSASWVERRADACSPSRRRSSR
jgi:hypothetical protein